MWQDVEVAATHQLYAREAAAAVTSPVDSYDDIPIVRSPVPTQICHEYPWAAQVVVGLMEHPARVNRTTHRVRTHGAPLGGLAG